MHELAVTESLLNLALRHAHQAEARRVADLHLGVGQLLSLVGDSVQFYWDIIGQDALCEGAGLHFRRVPAALLHLECQHAYMLPGGFTACPQGGSDRVRAKAGEEFRLESTDIESVDEPAGVGI